MKTNKVTQWAALLLTVSGLLSSIAPRTVGAQSALTVSGSAYTESGATHTTGNVNTVGSYTGTNIRFTGALTVSGSSALTADTGTF
ncbi:MAG: hypothetical protein LBD30_03620, partial [Verrucomicrobiales bacterium]|nr:hypothetical protein [Verrucomicrobiales bacterium]